MTDPYVHFRQGAPGGKPQAGGTLLYVKSDGKVYAKDSAGAEVLVGPLDTSGFATLTGTQTLTNKTISADNNTLSGIAASSFVLSNASGNIDGAVAQKVIPAGAVLGDTDTQTVTNKTLSTGTKVGAATTDISGAWTAWTPTFTNLTLGNGTLIARYVRMGNTVFYRLLVVFGSTTAVSGAVQFTLPITAYATDNQYTEALVISNGGTTPFAGRTFIAGNTTNAYPYISTSSTNTTLSQFGSFGMTLGTSSRFESSGTYETT